jgi:hypothetical protein
MEFRDIISIHSVNHWKCRLATCRASNAAACSKLPLCKCRVFRAVLLVLPNVLEDGHKKQMYNSYSLSDTRPYGGYVGRYVWDGWMDCWMNR